MRTAHRRAVLARLEGIPRDALERRRHSSTATSTPASSPTRVRGYELGTHYLALDPRDGVQTYAQYADQLPFARAADYASWLQRLDAYPRAVADAIALLREAVARKLLWPRASMERLPAQLDRLVTEPERSPFYAPFARIPASIARGRRGALARTRARRVAERVNPALRELRAFLVDVYLPAAPEAAGLAHVPGGDALYAYFARTYTTTDLTPDAIHELGLREVARIRARDGSARAADRATAVRSRTCSRSCAPIRRTTTRRRTRCCTRTARSSKRIDPELVRVFRTLPRLPYGVVPIPAALAPDTTTAYYYPGALDGSRAGLYYVNLYRPEQRPIYEMMVLSLHECVPGHHLQIALAQELHGLPDFRRASLAYTAYIEGWGLYAESLGDEMGLVRRREVEVRRADVPDVARGAARRRHRDARARLDAASARPTISSTTPRRRGSTSRTRSTATSRAPARRSRTRSAS